MRVLVLDRIFDGDDVPRVAQVDLVAPAPPASSSCRSRSGRRPGPARAAGGVSASTPAAGRACAKRGTADGRRRIAAAARPRSWCRLMRKRPRSGVRNDASAMPVVAIRLAARAAAAPARRRPRSPRRRAALRAAARPTPSTRSDGGAPATSSRSLADRSTTCSSHDAQPRGLLVGAARLRRAGVQLDDERVEIVRLVQPCRAHVQLLISGVLRNRASGAIWRNTASTRPVECRARRERRREARRRR